MTGQQIGLLGGPLYTTYKVLGTVFLANTTGSEAVYWLETNDADFNEINHIDFLDAQGQLQTLTWNIYTHGYSTGYVRVDEKLTAILETFFSTIRQTDFTPALKQMALDCYAPGKTLADASRQLASELFSGFDLKLFTPFETEFRHFSQRILRNEAEHTPEGEQCNLFCMMGKQRKALFRKDGHFILRDGSKVDLAARELVPNVRTRSVCQDAYFNVHTYVAGPGEVRYLSEMDSQYELHGVNKAAVQPRMSLSLIEPRVNRLLKKTGLTLEQVRQNSRDELVKLALNQHTGFDAGGIQKTAFTLTGKYLDQLAALGFEASELKAFRKNMQNDVKGMLGRLRAREKKKNKQLLDDAGYLSDSLMPYGKPQERVFNVFYYMNLFGGIGFIRWLYDRHDWQLKELEIRS